MYPGFVFAKKCVKMYPYQLCIIGGKPYLGEMRFLLSREGGENINQIRVILPHPSSAATAP